MAQQAAQEAAQPLFASEITTAKKLIDMIAEFFVEYSFQVIGGIIVLILGYFLAKLVAKVLSKFLASHNVDVTVSKFLVVIVKFTIIIFAALIALGNFGITIAPFIAGLSVAGFGLSFALQGPLSNYAAGVTLIFTKPFKVGDIIEVSGVNGEVQDMTLARTEVKTVDGIKIVIPNKQIIGEIIHNYSELKRLDIEVGVSYEADIDKAISIVKEVISSDERFSKKSRPKIGISEFADSSINIYARAWCKQADYWELLFDTNKKIYDEFQREGIVIPFPQRDIHIYETKSKKA